MKFLYPILFLILLSCDNGLEPPTVSKLIVTINYNSEWPESDSLVAMRFAAFKTAEPSNLIEEVISGNVFLYDLEINVDQQIFEYEILETPVHLKYIAVAWQNTSLLTDQIAAGIYSNDGGDTPLDAILNSGETIEITIDVDFNDLPPQPFD